MKDRKLFTFKLQKKTEDTTREFSYQVPAYSRDEALVKLGQTFHHDDKYELLVLEG